MVKKKTEEKPVTKLDRLELLRKLFNKKEYEPFGEEYIYPGKQVYAYKIGGEYVPCEHEITQFEDNKQKGLLNPITYDVLKWHAVQIKQNEIEFKKKNLWDENKTIFLCLITVLLCCAVCGVTIYYTYKFADGRLAASTSAFQHAVQDIQNVAGRGG